MLDYISKTLITVLIASGLGSSINSFDYALQLSKNVISLIALVVEKLSYMFDKYTTNTSRKDSDGDSISNAKWNILGRKTHIYIYKARKVNKFDNFTANRSRKTW